MADPTSEQYKEQRKYVNDLITAHNELKTLLDVEKNSLEGGTNSVKAQEIELEKRQATQKLINELESKSLILGDDERKLLKKLKEEQKGIAEQVKKENEARQAVNAVLSQYNTWLKQGWQYLMQSDKVIKSTILSLGLSGTKAAEMRLSFEQSADFVAKLGGNIEDVGKIMQGFADETGEARALSAEMVKDIEMIGKGTGLGVEQATKLAGQFRFMGLDATNTMKLVQGVVDTSERMGVNTTKVLKNVTDNFKKLNTFTFLKGSQGMAEMAVSAEKTRVSIEDTMTAAEKGRTLEGAVDMMAQLQVMGGAFAAMDPLQFLHDTRNDPEKITEQISQMTKGIVSLRKKSDGTFEKFISPADRDRLNGVAKTLGISLEDMTIIAQKRFDIDKLDRTLSGKGLTGREKEIIQGVAQFNASTTKYEVLLGGHMRDVASLTKEEAQSFAKQTVSLKDRAKDAMTFEEVFKATLNELKSALLPLLQTVNKMLIGIRPMIDKFTHFITTGWSPWLKVAGLFMATGLVWKGILQPFLKGLSSLTIGKLASKIRTIGPAAEVPVGGGAPIGGAGAGAGMLKGGAGIGAAALGVGGGIGIAAAGIGSLAKAIKDVDVEKLNKLNGTIAILGGTFVAILVPAMFALGAAGPFAAIGLVAVGAAAVGVGFGINLAAKGIGKMAEGFATMLEASKGVGPAFGEIATGIFKIGGASIVNAEGMNNFTDALKRIGKSAPGVVLVGKAFNEINTVLSGKKDDYEAILNVIESISKLNVKGGNIFSDLINLFKNPLKVEFDKNAKANFAINVDSHIDGTKIANHNLVQQVSVNTVDMRYGKPV